MGGSFGAGHTRSAISLVKILGFKRQIASTAALQDLHTLTPVLKSMRLREGCRTLNDVIGVNTP